MDIDLPTAGLTERWEALEADLEATAADLEADGWTTVALHAGDVTSRPGGDPPALEVLVPSNEFEVLKAHLADGVTFVESAVFRSAAGGVAYLVFVWRDPDRRVAALVPAIYPQRGRAATTLADHAREAGMVRCCVRPLRRDQSVTFTIDDPALVFPEEWR